MSIAPSDRNPRTIRTVLFFGSRCDFADIVLSSLCTSGSFKVAARIVPGSKARSLPFYEVSPTGKTSLPMAGSTPYPGISNDPSLDDIHAIIVNDPRSPDLAARLASFMADVSVVCCYPERIPLELVNSSQYGGLNIHPSLLPRYRGPEPLFWVYRSGETRSGVSIHYVTNRLDAGPIYAQQAVDIPIGKPGDKLWRESAHIGALMIPRAIERLVHGVPGTPQNESDASYQSWPEREDMIIRPEEWDAWHVHHFVNGVQPYGYTPLLVRDGVEWEIASSCRYVDFAEGIEPEHCGDGVWTSCGEGHVLLNLGRVIG